MSRLINPNFKTLCQARNNGMRGVVMEGSSRCFHPDQEIIVCSGIKKISDVCINDYVLSYNHKLNLTCYNKILAANVQPTKKRCFKITLKDGTIIKCTEDHKFYYNGRYVEIKNILSLL